MIERIACAECPLKNHNCGAGMHGLWDCPTEESKAALHVAWSEFLDFFKPKE